MLDKIKSILFVLLLAGLLVACAALATPVPTLVPPAPTATAAPHIPGNPITIPAGEGDETIKATITGNGDIAIMVHKTRDDIDTSSSSWAPLIDILGTNGKLRIVTYAIRDLSTASQDARAVFEYLRAEGVNRIICMSADLGQVCSNLQKEPEIIGMVFFSSDDINPIEAGFPKLFLTSEIGNNVGATKRVYEQSAEPKVLKTWAADRSGPAIFAKADVGPQVLADITNFINGIVSGQ